MSGMKVTNFGPGGFPLATSGWSSGITSLNSNVNTEDGGLSALNFVQGITANGSNMLLRPIANFAAGSNILLTLDAGPGNSIPSNTIRIHSTGGSGGNIITANGSNSLAAVVNLVAGTGIALGVSGQDVTITNTGSGGGGAPAAAGSLVLLESHTASASSSLDFGTRNATGQSGATIQSDYDDYMIEVIAIIPATGGSNLLFRVGTGAGPTYDSGSNYSWARLSWDSGSSGVTGSNSDTSILLIPRLISGGNHNGSATYYIKNPGGSVYKYIYGHSSSTDNSGTDPLGTVTRAAYNSTTAVTGLQILMSSGNITSGIVRVYGLAK